MFEAMSIAVTYKFSSNAGGVLGQIARQAERAAQATDLLTVSIDRSAVASRAFVTEARGVLGALREMQSAARRTGESIDAMSVAANAAQARMAAGYDSIAASSEAMADVAARNARRFGTANAVMGDASEDASARIAEGSLLASRRIGSVTRAANRASIAMAHYRAATEGIGGGNFTTPPGGFQGGRGGFGGGSGAVAGATARGGSEVGPGGVLGLASLAAMGMGVRQASNLQDATVQTAVAMGKSSDWATANLTPTAMKMSMTTAQSVADSMHLLKVMSKSGFSNVSNLKSLSMPIAQFADTQFLSAGTPFEESAAMSVKLAHQLGARSPAELKPVLNTLWKMSQDMPDSINDAAVQLKYYDQTYRKAGVSSQEILLQQATLDRLGYGSGRSGAGSMQILRTLQNPTKAQFAAQKELGFIGPDGHRDRFLRGGVFYNREFIDYVHAKDVEAHRKGGNAIDDYNSTLARAFTSNGTTILSALSSSAGISQYANVVQSMKRIVDMDEAQVQLMGTLANRTKQMTSNFNSLVATIAGPLLPALTTVVTTLGDFFGKSAAYLQMHPGQTGVLAVAGAGGAAFGTFKLAQMLGGFLSVFKHVSAHGARDVVRDVTRGTTISRTEHITETIVKTVKEAGGGKSILSMGGIAEGILDFVSFMPLLRGFKGAFKGGGGLLKAGLGALGESSVVRSGGFGAILKGAGASMPWIGKLVGGLRNVGAMGEFLTGVLRTVARFGIGGLATALARLGVRAIPIAGNILLAADALKLLGSHSKDIGRLIGEAAHWIVKTGGPMLKDSIISAAKYAFATVMSLFNGGHGGLFDDIKSTVLGLISGYKQGYNSGYDDPTRNYGVVPTIPGLPNPPAQPQSVVFNLNGPTHVHADDPSQFHAALMGAAGQHQSGASGTSNIVPGFPPALTIGIGSGVR